MARLSHIAFRLSRSDVNNFDSNRDYDVGSNSSNCRRAVDWSSMATQTNATEEYRQRCIKAKEKRCTEFKDGSFVGTV